LFVVFFSRRYIDTIQPLTNPQEFQHTKQLVSEFSKNEGPLLHEELKKLAAEAPTSWLEGFWDTMYLEYREPAPINVNPAFIFNEDKALRDAVGPEWIQVVRTAQLLHATAWFVTVLRSGRLAPDTLGAPPKQEALCMTQYGKLFGTCRLPVAGRDVIVSTHDSTHAVVLAYNQFYSIDIITSDNKPVSAIKLLQQLTAIRTASVLPTSEAHPVASIGALTCEHRDTWASIYPSLYENNKSTMDSLNSSVLLVCMDGPSGRSTLPSMDALCVEILHNNGMNR